MEKTQREKEDFKIATENYDIGLYNGRQEVIETAIKKIELVRDTVRKQTGSLKYDSCYEDCINILKYLNK